MKKLFFVICFLSLINSGCFIQKMHNKLFNPPDCSKPAAFATVIIAPFGTDEVMFDGITEGKEITNIGSSLKGITSRMEEQLNDKLTEYKKFDKIILGGNCVDGSIKIEGKVIELAHRHRTGYVMLVRGKILNCSTGESLYKFEIEEDDDELHSVPDKIAREIAEEIYEKLLCQPGTKTTAVQ